MEYWDCFSNQLKCWEKRFIYYIALEGRGRKNIHTVEGRIESNKTESEVM